MWRRKSAQPLDDSSFCFRVFSERDSRIWFRCRDVTVLILFQNNKFISIESEAVSIFVVAMPHVQASVAQNDYESSYPRTRMDNGKSDIFTTCVTLSDYLFL